MNRFFLAAALLLSGVFVVPVHAADVAEPKIKTNPLRGAYYGDLHLHTSYSFDAYLNSKSRVDPNTAYRFARGDEVEYLGKLVTRRDALDFTAVTDHSELLALTDTLSDPGSELSRSRLAAILTGDPEKAWAEVDGWPPAFKLADIDVKGLLRSAWKREVEAANRNYQPGKFTTFVAYEWTSVINEGNLHRNIIFKGDSAPEPFTAADSARPEDLWTWLERLRSKGYEVLAIPHNANASNGLMFDWLDSYGHAIDRNYAQRRQANEPLTEISQSKGSSETHPLLSASDEFANYEIFDYLAAFRVSKNESPPAGSYVRDGLGRGLVIQDKVGINPFKYGFIGSSDIHSGLTVSAQADVRGDPFVVNIGGGKATREEAAEQLGGRLPPDLPSAPLKATAGNLAGVWSESNTRESIFAALRRRETFATTGTRLRFRFFGGWDLPRELVSREDWVADAYARGVPMGSDLPVKPARARAPSFAVWAVKDPNSGSLDRVQIIKVWEDAGQHLEKIFDLAWSGARRPDPKTGRLPAVGNSVDLATGLYNNSIGATELKTQWIDPEFDPRHAAAYYLRVLEIPTPRWSTLLAVANGLPLPQTVPATIQQRGWSSPIWYTPSQSRQK